MAPRSASRLVGAKKPTRRRKSTRKSAAKKAVSFTCYAVAEDMAVSFFSTRKAAAEARDLFDEDNPHVKTDGPTPINKITVSSNEDLAKVLRDNTL